MKEAASPQSADVTAADTGTVTAPAVRVRIMADDPVTGDGMRAYLRTRTPLEVVDGDRARSAQVALVVTSEVTAETADVIKQVGRESATGSLPVVLVADSVS